jgi:hypothetical protein
MFSTLVAKESVSTINQTIYLAVLQRSSLLLLFFFPSSWNAAL